MLRPITERLLITAICAAVVTTFFWSLTGERRRAWLRLGWTAKSEAPPRLCSELYPLAHLNI
jgi:hypothetical protein